MFISSEACSPHRLQKTRCSLRIKCSRNDSNCRQPSCRIVLPASSLASWFLRWKYNVPFLCHAPARFPRTRPTLPRKRCGQKHNDFSGQAQIIKNSRRGRGSTSRACPFRLARMPEGTAAQQQATPVMPAGGPCGPGTDGAVRTAFACGMAPLTRKCKRDPDSTFHRMA